MKKLKAFKFLQIGLGSMGRRRIRNLLRNGIKPKNIFGFNISKDRCKTVGQEYHIQTTDNFKQAIKKFDPDIFIISTPPDTHSKYFLYAARNKKHFFVEHPTTDKGYDELDKLMDGSFVGAPSCTWRFNPAAKKIKSIVESGAIGKILYFQYHLGQYLPDWHPWEDYRQVYFAQKTTGACREMFAFELIWLKHALNLNKIKKISGITKKLSDLDMSADDLYSSILEFQNGPIGNMTIDLLSRKPLRTLRVIGSEGVLDWEWLDYKIKLYQTTNKKIKEIKLKMGRIEKHYVNMEDMYEEEMGHFLKAIRGKEQYPFTFRENRDLLKCLFALEKSGKSGRAVSV